MKSTKESLDPSVVEFAPYDVNTAFWNARQTFTKDGMEYLRESIKNDGLIQDSFTVRKLGKKYQLVCGERRLRVIQSLISKNEICHDMETGKKIPAKQLYKIIHCKVLHECSDKEAARLSIAENLEREDVCDLDLMAYCIRLCQQKDKNGKEIYKREEIQQIISRSATWVSQTMSLSELPDRAQKMLANGTIHRTVALKLLNVQPKYLEKVIKTAEDLSSIALEEEKGAIEQQINMLEGDLEKASVKAVAASSTKDPNKIEKVKSLKQALNDKLKEAKDQKKVIKAKKPRLTVDVLQQSIDGVQGARKGKLSPLSHKVIKAQLSELEEQESDKFPKRDMEVAKTVLKMVVGATPERHIIKVLEALQKK